MSDYPVSYQQYFGSLLNVDFFSGTQTLLFSFLGGVNNSATLTDTSGVLYVGEEFILDGRTVSLIGSGTAQPGVDILGVTVPSGTIKDLLYVEDTTTGEKFFVYPDGAPNFTGAIALVVDLQPVGYSMTAATPICFCRGTEIAVPDGKQRIEKIREGDQVLDYGGEVLTVIEARRTRYDILPNAWAPIVIEPNALGPDTPNRRLKVSPQHRLALPVSQQDSDLPLLAPAKAFTVLPGVHRARKRKPVVYIHLLTERHALLRANNLPAESLLPTRVEADDEIGPDTEMVAQVSDADHKLVDAQPCGKILSTAAARQILRTWTYVRDSGCGPVNLSRTYDFSDAQLG
ncbi:Hint domain-containing protein [Litorisediminicola beolgyonensis]|uniref:Hint domain-containing protein n=1 Tax=Litorisediminicola beolgyonensis TaxID=1173614 RepID=A0ABW3ZHT1_9RHOB